MKKKILVIVSLSLIGLIGLTTIFLAVCPTSSRALEIEKPTFAVYFRTKELANRHSINPGALDGETAKVGAQQQINDIWENLTNAPKQTVLTAMFSGTISEKISIEEGSYVYMSNAENISDENQVFVAFEYPNKQTVMFNGKVYPGDKNNDGDTNDSGEKETYDLVFFTLTGAEERTTVKFYLATWTSSTNASAKYYYTMTGNYYNLFQLVNNFETSI